MRAVEGKRSAELVAAMRAVGARDREVANPDHLAGRMLRGGLRLLLLPGVRNVAVAFADRRVPGMYLYHQARTKYLDELFLASIDGVDQVVVLGAGLDTRAYRFAEQLDGRRVFEVDHPGTAAWKRDRVQRLGVSTDHVTYVTTDFNEDRLDETLARAGCRLDDPTFFLWEGVVYYLPPGSVESTFEVVAQATSGSSIAFDYVYRSSLERPAEHFGAVQYHRSVERTGEPVLSGFDPDEVAPFLDRHGLRVVSNVGRDELARLIPAEPVCDFFGIVHAERT